MATKFLADAMLGSLARKLRAFGFDTIYLRDSKDEALVAAAKKERRILLTADVALASRASAGGAEAFLLSGATDAARLRSMAAQASERGLKLLGDRPTCSECNGPLVSLPKSAVRGLAPESVVSRHRLFFRCRNCGKVYWRGGHWKKLRRLRRVLAAKAVS